MTWGSMLTSCQASSSRTFVICFHHILIVNSGQRCSNWCNLIAAKRIRKRLFWYFYFFFTHYLHPKATHSPFYLSNPNLISSFPSIIQQGKMVENSKKSSKFCCFEGPIYCFEALKINFLKFFCFDQLLSSR